MSYASQDADAALRLCEALRAAGVEVWFDQNELVGGDAWDAKIRKQIAECALFVPIISANTQARLEGYFRVEWKLAAQRTHAMAEEKAFLLPVVLDDTRDTEAKVPGEFKAVQWTRLAPSPSLRSTGRQAYGGQARQGGVGRDEAIAAFCGRVRKLLGGSAVLQPALEVPERGVKHRATPQTSRRVPTAVWIAAAVVAVGSVMFFAWQSTQQAGGAARPISAEKSTASLSEAQKLVRQARALLDDDPMQLRENYFLADELAQRAVKVDPTEGEAWAIAGRASTLLLRRKFDASPARKDLARMQVERGMSLAPASIESAFAQALQQDAAGRLADAQRILEELTKRTPGDWRFWDALGELSLKAKRVEVAIDFFRQAQTLSGGDSRPAAGEIRALLRLGRLAEVRVKLDRLMAGKPGRAAYLSLLLSKAIYFYDVAGAKALIEKIPPRVLQEDSVISTLAEFFLRTGDGDRALEELKRMPRDFFEDGWDWRPRGYLAGYAHQVAGRPTAAQAEWKQALAVVEKRLAAEPNETLLLYWKSLLQALTGQTAEARAGRKLLRELEKPENGWFDSILQVAIGDREEAIQSLAKEWPTTDFALRNDLWGDWLYAPWYAAIRDDPRIRAMAMEHKAAIEQALNSAPSTAKEDKSVAVLAFTNLSDDKNNEFFADGISVELLERLGSVAGLKVAAQRSAFHFKGTNTPIPEIARQLGVAYVVDGSVRRAGDQVRISAQLIKATDGFRVWGETFTREVKNLFAVQDEIAGLVAKNLELKLGGRAGPSREIDPEAYQEYLSGRAAAAKASMEDLRRAVTHFERAVAKEPSFAAAWVQLAGAHTQLGRWGGAPTREAWPAARTAINRARALDPDSPDVLLALSWILRTADWDWRGAEQALRRAMVLRPDHPDTLSAASVLLFNVGKHEEAFRLGRQAAKLDPLNGATQIDLSLMFFFSDSWPEAERAARRALQLSPTGMGYHAILAWSLIAQRKLAEGEAELALDQSELERINGFGLLALARGQTALARDCLAKLNDFARIDPDRADLQQSIAWLCAGLGEIDRAFAALEKAYASRDPSVSWSRTMWPLRPLHADARWGEFLRRIGLADDQLK